jgi:hypothetical protein
MKGNDALMSCGKYPAGMTLVEMVSTIDIYIERICIYFVLLLIVLRLCV